MIVASTAAGLDRVEPPPGAKALPSSPAKHIAACARALKIARATLGTTNTIQRDVAGIGRTSVGGTPRNDCKASKTLEIFDRPGGFMPPKAQVP